MNDIFDHVVDPVSQMQDSFSLAEFLLGDAAANEVSFCDDEVPDIKKKIKIECQESPASDDSSRPSPAYSLPYQVPSGYSSNAQNSTAGSNLYYQSSPSPEQASFYMQGVPSQSAYPATRYLSHQPVAVNGAASPYFPYYGYHDRTQRSRLHQVSPDEQEKRKVRRERNKLAALRCRTRRRERIEVLEQETSELEDKNKTVEEEIAALRKEMNELQDILVSHKCVMNSSAGLPEEEISAKIENL